MDGGRAVTVAPSAATGSAPRIARLALVTLGVSFGVLAETQGAGRLDRPALFTVADLLSGWSFLAAGAIAWDRRPRNRLGPVLVAIGFAWFVGTFGASDSALVAYLGRGLQGFYEPLLAFVVLAYPTGHLTSPTARAVATTWLLDHAAWSSARLLFDRPFEWYDCPTCPATIDAYVRDQQLLDAIGPVTLAISAGLAFVVLVVVVGRLARAGPAGRRRLTPIAVAGGALGASVGLTAALRLTIAPTLFHDLRLGAAYDVVAMLVAVAILVGLLQDRLARSAVADLVMELRAAGPSGDAGRIQAALAQALGDPGLRYLPFDAAAGRFRAFDGALVDPPLADARHAVTTLGGPAAMGVVVHDRALLDEPGLLEATRAAVALESENARLGAEVDRQLEEVRASRQRIVEAADGERRRVERDLHDGAQQRLLALALEVGRLRTHARAIGNAPLESSLVAIAGNLESAIDELRELARGILPPILTEAGLAAAIDSLALRSPIPVRVDVVLDGRMPPAVESTAYFVVAEALTNVARHASAREASVSGRIAGGQLRIVVEDDGVGGADERGSGLRGLADRVRALGGGLTIGPATGSGTRLVAELPLGQ